MNLDSIREWKERIVEEKSIEREQRIERYQSSVNSVRELQEIQDCGLDRFSEGGLVEADC